jgi:hypothetical protein
MCMTHIRAHKYLEWFELSECNILHQDLEWFKPPDSFVGF